MAECASHIYLICLLNGLEIVNIVVIVVIVVSFVYIDIDVTIDDDLELGDGVMCHCCYDMNNIVEEFGFNNISVPFSTIICNSLMGLPVARITIRSGLFSTTSNSSG